MSAIRCGQCSHWLGEATVDLVFVGAVDHSSKARIEAPRDLRYCKSCGMVNVFVPRADIDIRIARTEPPSLPSG